MAALITGLLQLPLAEFIPFRIPDLPLMHYYVASGIIFLTVYIIAVWLCIGRVSYKLTSFGWLCLFVYGILIGTGLLLILDTTNYFILYGLSFSLIKCVHLFFAVIIFMALLLSVFKSFWSSLALVQKKQD